MLALLILSLVPLASCNKFSGSWQPMATEEAQKGSTQSDACPTFFGWPCLFEYCFYSVSTVERLTTNWLVSFPPRLLASQNQATTFYQAKNKTMTMMMTNFEPTLLSPLSEPSFGRLVLPHAPSPRKRSSDRVSTLLLDNLELLQAPLLTANKAPRLEMQPTTAKSALMENALKRMREKGEGKITPVAPATPRARRAPRLPQRQPSPTQHRTPERTSSTSSLPKVDMERTPIRSPPERSNSGLARCA